MPPVTVTGTLQTLTSGRIAQGKVIFQLTNIGTGNPVGVSGTSIIPALTYTVMTAQDGSFSVSLWGNDALTPANTLYAVTFRDFQGNEIGPVLYSITGASANLNTLVSAGTVTPPVITPNAVLTNPAALQTINNFPLALAAGLQLNNTGRLNLLGFNTTTVPMVAGNNNNIAIGSSSIVTLNGSPGSSVTLTGMAAGSTGDVVIIFNNLTTIQTITLSLEDVNSAAINRFRSNQAVNTVLHANVGAAICFYDTARWTVISATPGS